jgi:hypothetical protein
LCALFTTRYGWPHWEVTLKVIEAIEHHYQLDRSAHLGLPSATAAVVARGSAPKPRQPGLIESLPAALHPRPQRSKTDRQERG